MELIDLLKAHQFVVAVTKRLPKIRKADVEIVEIEILKHYELGWTIEETIRWMMCCEEVNPKLKEETALARMQRIIADVQKRRL